MITGDLARCDEDGYFWFHGRADDVITSAGFASGLLKLKTRWLGIRPW